MSRKKSWTLEESTDGLVTVVWSGRTLRSGVTLDWAKRWVRQRRKDHEPVFLEEPDGYRRNITRTL